MVEKIIYGYNLPSAYHQSLKALSEYGEIAPCSDYNTTQKEISVTIKVENPLQEPMISKLFPGDPRSLEQYRQEILYGILDFEIEQGNWHYTYHNRMEKQIPWIIEELHRNPDSRRAVIDVRTLEDLQSDSPACLQHLQFFIRNDKLHCKVLFRSNDACKATFMNMFALIMLQKSIADELKVEMGTYTHRANSFHCYEKDFPMLEGYIKRISLLDNTTYEYLGEWQEMMEESQQSISDLVQELKNRH